MLWYFIFQEQQEAGDAAEENPDDSNNQTKDSDAEEATLSSQIKEEDNQDAENIVEQNGKSRFKNAQSSHKFVALRVQYFTTCNRWTCKKLLPTTIHYFKISSMNSFYW